MAHLFLFRPGLCSLYPEGAEATAWSEPFVVRHSAGCNMVAGEAAAQTLPRIVVQEAGEENEGTETTWKRVPRQCVGIFLPDKSQA